MLDATEIASIDKLYAKYMPAAGSCMIQKF